MAYPSARFSPSAPRRALRPGLWPAVGLVVLATLTLACSGSEHLAAEAPAAEPMPLHLDGAIPFTDWTHAPLRPLDREPVAFTVSALPTEAVAASLYVYEYELFRDREGRPSQRRRPGGLWGKLAEWAPDEVGGKAFARSHTHAAGFGPHTRVEYVWRLQTADGRITDRFARFDAGRSPWPRDKVLLYSASRRPMSETIDIGFFRDTDYGDSLALYRREVEAMIKEGFLAEGTFGPDREHWAFYTTDRSADGAAISADVTNQDLLPEFLKDFSVPGIDAFCLVHRESYTDRSLLLENFHSLSNNLFSAESYNHGTAVHECGHAIFHLSDEYGGCACFQTHASSNVFREAADCAAWNRANGFPAADCYELRDLYDRAWYSAERPTFFATKDECRDHNRALGMSGDSCRTFIDKRGDVKYWAFESTCIMHDDGDDLVRPFQRACGRVIEGFYEELPRGGGTLAQAVGERPRSASAEAQVGLARYENVYGYEPVVHLAMRREGQRWSVAVEGASQGVPTPPRAAGGEVSMRLLDAEGHALATYQLASPGAVHVHAAEDAFAVPDAGAVRIAVPANNRLTTVACEFDRNRAARGATFGVPAYRQGFTFDVAADVSSALQTIRTDR